MSSANARAAEFHTVIGKLEEWVCHCIDVPYREPFIARNHKHM